MSNSTTLFSRPGPTPGARLLLVLSLIGILVTASCGESDHDDSDQAAGFDLIVAGGRLIDGSGNPWFRADIGVAAGRITAIGDLSGKQAHRRVDASGKIVSPGFIDLHSHADDDEGAEHGLRSDNIRRRRAENIVTQGVTTVVVNPDGSGEPGLSIAAQRAQLQDGGIGPNVALMVAHNAIRAEVLQDDYERLATPEEVAAMQRRVREGMQEGAFGLTTGLEYVPGRWSNVDELVALVKELEPFNGVHISHMRSETSAPMWWVPSLDDPTPPELLDAVAEIIEVAERTATRGVVSHMKVRGTTHWGQSEQVIQLIEAARSRGVEVYGDQYPYNSSGSDGRVVFIPDWALGLSEDEESKPNLPDALAATLSDSTKRITLFRDIEHAISFRGGAANIVVFEFPDESLIGRNLEELAKERSITPVEMVIELQMKGYTDRPGGARLRSFSLAVQDIERLMVRPWVATSSDGGVSLPEDGAGVHARYYGAFARKIARYARDRSTISLEHAVRAATSLPAQVLGLDDRGFLREGVAADLVVFDYEKIEDAATFTEPHQYARGIEHVLVNGIAVVTDGRPTGQLPGQVLHPAAR